MASAWAQSSGNTVSLVHEIKEQKKCTALEHRHLFQCEESFFTLLNLINEHTHTHKLARRAEGPQVGKSGIFTRLAPRSPFSTVDSRAAGHQNKAGSVCTQWAAHLATLTGTNRGCTQRSTVDCPQTPPHNRCKHAALGVTALEQDENTPMDFLLSAILIFSHSFKR